ncbi:MAG: AAA family ATPase [Gemmatimonadota bacterium]
MNRHGLPTKWALYNLEASPYFQDVLEASEPSPQPLRSLFVGRQEEIEELEDRIVGAGLHGTRQGVAGLPGVGKTTLVQELKSKLLDRGYFSTDSWVPLYPEDTSEQVFGRVLVQVYDTILANRPHMAAHPAMRDAQLLVRVSRIIDRGGTVSVAGFGIGGQSIETPSVPTDLLIDGPRVMRDLMHAIGQSDARGIIVHVNNLETLTETESRRAGEILRGLRDPLMMHPRLHLVFVGTQDALSRTLMSFPQVRNVVSITSLAALDLATARELLRARYEHLQANPDHPVVAPADEEAVAVLHELYGGDLRGLLKALEDGVRPLLGLIGVNEAGAAAPLPLDAILPVLKERYNRDLDGLPEQTRVEQLRNWGKNSPDAPMTQQDLVELWGVAQPTVSRALQYLGANAYVVALPREGREEGRYVLSGTARLIFS